MFDLPIFAIPLLVVAIVVLITIGGFYAYRHRRLQYRRFFGVDPKSGSEESRNGIVGKVLERMVWELETLGGLLDYYNQRATTAVDTDTAVGIHVFADQTRQEILQSSEELSRAVIVAGHFDHRGVVQELNLQQYLPSQGH